ncbi:N-acetylmannosamine kinase [Spiroplasma sabaudiense Ar-1343]|uniref:N-acetylmannosamine kinase n=1 Tax=Spiroplasma sabaudiense Ar-1343 TaxID=1276257 RepID=W6AJC0_9MOLU|nr:ROK family protein [Spiroplasma sabaudiense]AHI53814.1 N-acetylmannosamine kinase [Spiroplasma sabaudiense Ar-1343]
MKNNLILCFDIGGLGLKVSLYDLDMNEKFRTKFTYKLLEKKTIFDLIKNTYQEVGKDFDITAIAISASGIIDAKNKLMYSLKDSNSKLIQDDLHGYMKWCTIPWFIENDANCALLAEKYFGAAQSKKNICLITIGTALGGALMINEKIYVGSHFMANEIGCGILDNNFTNFKNISVQTGMNGLVEEYNSVYNKNLEGIDILKLAEKDSLSKEYQIVKSRLVKIAQVIINMYFTVDPELILIGGGVSANSWYLEELKKTIKEIEAIVGVPILAEIKSCQFQNDAGKIGALALYLDDKGIKTYE